MRQDTQYLERRIKELEDKVFQLRLSRRILMYLLEEANREREASVRVLKRENERLRLANYRYARMLVNKNQQIVNLQSRLRSLED